MSYYNSGSTDSVTTKSTLKHKTLRTKPQQRISFSKRGGAKASENVKYFYITPQALALYCASKVSDVDDLNNCFKSNEFLEKIALHYFNTSVPDAKKSLAQIWRVSNKTIKNYVANELSKKNISEICAVKENTDVSNITGTETNDAKSQKKSVNATNKLDTQETRIEDSCDTSSKKRLKSADSNDTQTVASVLKPHVSSNSVNLSAESEKDLFVSKSSKKPSESDELLRNKVSKRSLEVNKTEEEKPKKKLKLDGKTKNVSSKNIQEISATDSATTYSDSTTECLNTVKLNTDTLNKPVLKKVDDLSVKSSAVIEVTETDKSSESTLKKVCTLSKNLSNSKDDLDTAKSSTDGSEKVCDLLKKLSGTKEIEAAKSSSENASEIINDLSKKLKDTTEQIETTKSSVIAIEKVLNLSKNSKNSVEQAKAATPTPIKTFKKACNLSKNSNNSVEQAEAVIPTPIKTLKKACNLSKNSNKSVEQAEAATSTPIKTLKKACNLSKNSNNSVEQAEAATPTPIKTLKKACNLSKNSNNSVEQAEAATPTSIKTFKKVCNLLKNSNNSVEQAEAATSTPIKTLKKVCNLPKKLIGPTEGIETVTSFVNTPEKVCSLSNKSNDAAEWTEDVKSSFAKTSKKGCNLSVKLTDSKKRTETVKSSVNASKKSCLVPKKSTDSKRGIETVTSPVNVSQKVCNLSKKSVNPTKRIEAVKPSSTNTSKKGSNLTRKLSEKIETAKLSSNKNDDLLKKLSNATEEIETTKSFETNLDESKINKAETTPLNIPEPVIESNENFSNDDVKIVQSLLTDLVAQSVLNVESRNAVAKSSNNLSLTEEATKSSLSKNTAKKTDTKSTKPKIDAIAVSLAQLKSTTSKLPISNKTAISKSASTEATNKSRKQLTLENFALNLELKPRGIQKLSKHNPFVLVTDISPFLIDNKLVTDRSEEEQISDSNLIVNKQKTFIEHQENVIEIDSNQADLEYKKDFSITDNKNDLSKSDNLKNTAVVSVKKTILKKKRNNTSTRSSDIKKSSTKINTDLKQSKTRKSITSRKVVEFENLSEKNSNVTKENSGDLKKLEESAVSECKVLEQIEESNLKNPEMDETKNKKPDEELEPSECKLVSDTKLIIVRTPSKKMEEVQEENPDDVSADSSIRRPRKCKQSKNREKYMQNRFGFDADLINTISPTKLPKTTSPTKRTNKAVTNAVISEEEVEKSVNEDYKMDISCEENTTKKSMKTCVSKKLVVTIEDENDNNSSDSTSENEKSVHKVIESNLTKPLVTEPSVSSNTSDVRKQNNAKVVILKRSLRGKKVINPANIAAKRKSLLDFENTNKIVKVSEKCSNAKINEEMKKPIVKQIKILEKNNSAKPVKTIDSKSVSEFFAQHITGLEDLNNGYSWGSVYEKGSIHFFENNCHFNRKYLFDFWNKNTDGVQDILKKQLVEQSLQIVDKKSMSLGPLLVEKTASQKYEELVSQLGFDNDTDMEIEQNAENTVLCYPNTKFSTEENTSEIQVIVSENGETEDHSTDKVMIISDEILTEGQFPIVYFQDEQMIQSVEVQMKSDGKEPVVLAEASETEVHENINLQNATTVRNIFTENSHASTENQTQCEQSFIVSNDGLLIEDTIKTNNDKHAQISQTIEEINQMSDTESINGLAVLSRAVDMLPRREIEMARPKPDAACKKPSPENTAVESVAPKQSGSTRSDDGGLDAGLKVPAAPTTTNIKITTFKMDVEYCKLFKPRNDFVAFQRHFNVYLESLLEAKYEKCIIEMEGKRINKTSKTAMVCLNCAFKSCYSFACTLYFDAARNGKITCNVRVGGELNHEGVLRKNKKMIRKHKVIKPRKSITPAMLEQKVMKRNVDKYDFSFKVLFNELFDEFKGEIDFKLDYYKKFRLRFKEEYNNCNAHITSKKMVSIKTTAVILLQCIHKECQKFLCYIDYKDVDSDDFVTVKVKIIGKMNHTGPLRIKKRSLAYRRMIRKGRLCMKKKKYDKNEKIDEPTLSSDKEDGSGGSDNEQFVSQQMNKYFDSSDDDDSGYDLKFEVNYSDVFENLENSIQYKPEYFFYLRKGFESVYNRCKVNILNKRIGQTTGLAKVFMYCHYKSCCCFICNININNIVDGNVLVYVKIIGEFCHQNNLKDKLTMRQNIQKNTRNYRLFKALQQRALSEKVMTSRQKDIAREIHELKNTENEESRYIQAVLQPFIVYLYSRYQVNVAHTELVNSGSLTIYFASSSEVVRPTQEYKNMRYFAGVVRANFSMELGSIILPILETVTSQQDTDTLRNWLSSFYSFSENLPFTRVVTEFRWPLITALVQGWSKFQQKSIYDYLSICYDKIMMSGSDLTAEHIIPVYVCRASFSKNVLYTARKCVMKGKQIAGFLAAIITDCLMFSRTIDEAKSIFFDFLILADTKYVTENVEKVLNKFQRKVPNFNINLVDDSDIDCCLCHYSSSPFYKEFNTLRQFNHNPDIPKNLPINKYYCPTFVDNVLKKYMWCLPLWVPYLMCEGNVEELSNSAVKGWMETIKLSILEKRQRIKCQSFIQSVKSFIQDLKVHDKKT